jgi:zinc/manganese transport system ATP-binding protein
MTIRFDNLTAGYDRHPAIHHIHGQFTDASLTAIVGPNGGGKSTLLKTLIGFLRPMSGSIDFGNLKTPDIAYLPQQSEIDRSFPISVLEVVLLGAWPKTGAFRRITATQEKQAATALEQVGMAAYTARPIITLSVGQWQRVLFARLIMQDARLLLLDEPFAAIDSRATHDLMHIVQQWQRDGRTVIAVMHDLPLVREHFPDALMLARDLIAWGPTTDVLSDANMARAQTLSSHWADTTRPCDRKGAAQ